MTSAAKNGTEATPPRAPQRRLAVLSLKFAVMGAASLLALAVAELALRVALPQQRSWLDIYATSDSPPYTLEANASRTIDTGESTWHVYTDSRGFRTAKAKALSTAPTLLILGDSFPFGMGVDYEASIAGYIDSALAGKYRVVNASVPGYGPPQYRQVLERELARGTRIAGVMVFTYMGNDFHDCVWKKTGEVVDGVLGNERSLRSFIKQNSDLYRLTGATLHRLIEREIESHPHEPELYRPEAWTTSLARAHEIFSQEFSRIRDLCRSRDIPLLAGIIPSGFAVDSADPGASLPVIKAKGILTSAQISFVDITPSLLAVGTRKAYFSWDQHLNVTGNRIAAEAMVAAWSPQLPTRQAMSTEGAGTPP